MCYTCAERIQLWEQFRALRRWKSQKAERLVEEFVPACEIQRGREGLLAEFLALLIDHEGYVAVVGRGQSQKVLEMDLARRRIQQVSASDDIGDALIRIVNDTAN
jgi:hypothetical protein